MKFDSNLIAMKFYFNMQLFKQRSLPHFSSSTAQQTRLSSLFPSITAYEPSGA